MLEPIKARLALTLGFVLALWALAFACPAHAAPPASISLPHDTNVHFVVAVAATGIALDAPNKGALTLGAFSGGVGAGIDFWASSPYTVTIAGAGMAVAGVNGASSAAQVAAFVGFARYYYAGVTALTTGGGHYVILGLDVLRVATGS